MDIFTILLLLGIFLTSILCFGGGTDAPRLRCCPGRRLWSLAFWRRISACLWRRWIIRIPLGAGCSISVKTAALRDSAGRWAITMCRIFIFLARSLTAASTISSSSSCSPFFSTFSWRGAVCGSPGSSRQRGQATLCLFGRFAYAHRHFKRPRWGQCDSIYVAFGVWAGFMRR